MNTKVNTPSKRCLVILTKAKAKMDKGKDQNVTLFVANEANDMLDLMIKN